MFTRLNAEIDSYFSRDPAARTRLEVLLCYPGLHAICLYRLTNKLWRMDWKLAARFIAHLGRMFTGIEIHPGATIGQKFFIDHGMGVVIGETAKIGNNVTLYHDVTLGGTSWVQGIRHPQLGNDVIVGAGAQLLGPINIGDGARIGSNAVVVKDVPAGATVVGIPAREVAADAPEVRHEKFQAYGTPQDEASFPNQQSLKAVHEQLKSLASRIEELEAMNAALAAEAKGTADKWEKHA